MILPTQVKRPELFTHAVSNYGGKWTVDRAMSGMTVLWGRPGSGKSFVAVSMAAAVASGRPWMGRSVTQGPVIYGAGEGGVPNVGMRIQAALRGMNAPWYEDEFSDPWDEQVPDLFILGGGYNLLAGPQGLLEAIGDIRPSLIVLDTLQRYFGGGNENQQDDMGKFVESVGRIQEHFDCAVLIVHHANRRGQVRGSSVLDASADVVWKLERQKGPAGKAGKVVTLTPEKLRECDVEGGQLNIMLKIEPAYGVDRKLLLDDVGREQHTLVALPTKAFLDSVQHVADRAEVLLRALDQITYQQWEDVSDIDPAAFNNAVHAILLEPGKYKVIHEGKGYFRAVTIEDHPDNQPGSIREIPKEQSDDE